jgi:hypothetical protein
MRPTPTTTTIIEAITTNTVAIDHILSDAIKPLRKTYPYGRVHPIFLCMKTYLRCVTGSFTLSCLKKEITEGITGLDGASQLAQLPDVNAARPCGGEGKAGRDRVEERESTS